MKLKATSLTLLIALSGCAATDHIYNSEGQCLTCFNNPLTGEALNHDGTNNTHMNVDREQSDSDSQEPQTSTQPVQSYTMHEVKYNAGINVDVAFIALKDEFEFRSAEEVKKEMGSFAEFKLRAADYEWKVIPQVSYVMGSAKKVMGSFMNLLVTVNKRTDTSSTIIVQYWPRDKSLNSEAVGKHLLERVEHALAN